VEDDYNQARARFTDSKGRVRFQWSSRSIREMATEVGRHQEYELPYGVACSIHHGNFEGLARLFTSHAGEVTPDPPPSLAWVKDALLAAHTNPWFALATLDEACGLGFSEQLEAAQKDHARVWQA